MGQILFNKPFIAGKELYYIAQAVTYGNIGGDGRFTEQCSELLQELTGASRVLMTPSCTAALEMTAMLCDLQPGDEIIMPSFTFVSTANAFVRVGAKPVFVDVRADTLHLDESQIEAAIGPRTRAICPVHYAGVCCEMDRINEIALSHNLLVIEDAAQAVNAFYKGNAAGSLGDLGCFSFHETKNYICGEGGALCLNSPELIERAEIIRDKGTNRKQFFRGQVDKYTWVDVGSSFVPSEIACAFLYGQLEMFDVIARRRHEIDEIYRVLLGPLESDRLLRLPFVPKHCGTNNHMFYVLLPDQNTRDELMDHLRQQGIQSVFHFVPLHSSPMGQRVAHSNGTLPVTDRVSQCLLRLPFFYEIKYEDQLRVVQELTKFLRNRAVTITSEQGEMQSRKAA